MIKIENLKKSFGGLQAVNGLSFAVKPGEVLGFLGPNGAGKSTTMKMLTGFLAPTSGQISVDGIDVVSAPKAAQQRIGYLPEGAPAYGDMTVSGFLRFIAQIRGFKGSTLDSKVAEVVEKVQLKSVMGQRIETLSKGFKRRVGIAQAIIHDPKVLILDEPTDGLDPNQKHQVRQLIKNLSRDKIVIVSTHILEEVHAVCTRAMIIAQGQVLVDGTPDELAAMSRYHQAITLRFAQPKDVMQIFTSLPGVASVECDSEQRSYTLFPVSGQPILSEVNSVLHEQNWDIEELHVEKGRLEDVFRQVTLKSEAPDSSVQLTGSAKVATQEALV
ncbi:MAG: ABC transporter ATP-binding protein [Pseudomonadales bacterium]|nr:ABC transporter ATP-binding protein [Pseudomonadales bacterium]